MPIFLYVNYQITISFSRQLVKVYLKLCQVYINLDSFKINEKKKDWSIIW